MALTTDTNLKQQTDPSSILLISSQFYTITTTQTCCHPNLHPIPQTPSINMRTTTAICVLASLAATNAFTVSNPSATRSTALNALSRDNFLKQVAGVAGAAVVSGLVNPLSAFAEEEIKLPSGTSYVIVKKGDGPSPKVGELAGIRFRADVLNGNKVDDIFDSPEPYYTRVGSGGLLKVNFIMHSVL